MFKLFKSWATMKITRPEFQDIVSGHTVYRYVDCYGVHWLAGKFRFFFRVKCAGQPVQDDNP